MIQEGLFAEPERGGVDSSVGGFRVFASSLDGSSSVACTVSAEEDT